MRRALVRCCSCALACLNETASTSGRGGLGAMSGVHPWAALWGRAVKTQSNDLRVGAVFEDRDGRLLEVLKYEHTHGQGRASGFVTLEARDLRNGAKRVERLRPSDTVERVILDSTVRAPRFLLGCCSVDNACILCRCLRVLASAGVHFPVH